VPTANGDRPLSKEELRSGEVLRANPFDPSHPIQDPINPQVKTIAAEQYSLPVHPAELYSTFTGLLLAALLVAYFSTGPKPGMVFALMMVLEGIARFVLELLRVEPPVTYVHGYGLSLSMVLGIVIAIGGVILMFVFSRFGSSASEPRLATA
jgi:prolipoprotein diacylglyceryltransferase